tara:strand:- start:2385 stop:2525 length:141 start_codon:yes stop_codon:yes gene_type:complete
MISFTNKQLSLLITIIMDSKEYTKEKQELLDILVFERIRLNKNDLE